MPTVASARLAPLLMSASRCHAFIMDSDITAFLSKKRSFDQAEQRKFQSMIRISVGIGHWVYGFFLKTAKAVSIFTRSYRKSFQLSYLCSSRSPLLFSDFAHRQRALAIELAGAIAQSANANLLLETGRTSLETTMGRRRPSFRFAKHRSLRISKAQRLIRRQSIARHREVAIAAFPFTEGPSDAGPIPATTPLRKEPRIRANTTHLQGGTLSPQSWTANAVRSQRHPLSLDGCTVPR